MLSTHHSALSCYLPVDHLWQKAPFLLRWTTSWNIVWNANMSGKGSKRTKKKAKKRTPLVKKIDVNTSRAAVHSFPMHSTKAAVSAKCVSHSQLLEIFECNGELAHPSYVLCDKRSAVYRNRLIATDLLIATDHWIAGLTMSKHQCLCLSAATPSPLPNFLSLP